MNNKNFIIVLLILVVVAALGSLSYLPAKFDTAPGIEIKNIPKTIGDWSATDIPLSERDYEILETKNLIMRDYKNQNGGIVYAYIVYSEDNRKVSHPPEVCFMGSGATIVNKSALQINKLITANKMIVEKGDTQQIVAYWYRAGNWNTNKYLKQQIQTVINRLFGKRASGALVRLSTDIDKDGEAGAIRRIRSFASQLIPLLPKYAP